MGLSYPYLTFSVDFANYYHINKKKILKSRKNKTKGIFICKTSQYYHMSKHELKLAEMTCELGYEIPNFVILQVGDRSLRHFIPTVLVTCRLSCLFYDTDFRWR